MGLFSFIKNAGEKLFGKNEEEVQKEAAVESTDQCNTCVKTSYFDHFLVGNYGTHETVVYQAR